MEKRTIAIRINYKDWKALRSIFPKNRGESVAHYIERVIWAWENGGLMEALNEEKFKLE